MARTVRRSPCVLATLAVALVLAACGQGTAATAGPGAATQAAAATKAPGDGASGGGAGTARAACDLLTDADIKSITGLTVADRDDDPADTIYENVCRWTFKENNGSFDLGVLGVDARTYLERTIETQDFTEVEGLGDRAVRTDISDSLLVLVGDTLLDIFTVGTGTGDEVESRLAERVLANLGA